MKVALCCVGRLENRYAQEYIEYYKNLGVNHIYVCDNNRDGEEHFEDVLQEYINQQFITILNYRNQERIQTLAFIECYNTYGPQYDYMMFFDFDEFLTLNNHNSIEEYLLENIEDYDVICINNKIYTDNDLINDDGRPCLERFTEATDDNFVLNRYVKSIVKTGHSDISWVYTHIPHCNYETDTLRYCNNHFEQINFSSIHDMNIEYNDDYAYLKHFFTKTINEFIIKLNKGGGLSPSESLTNYRIRNFFIINKRTEEKEQILQEYIESNNIII